MITNYGWTGFVKGMAGAQPLPFLLPSSNASSPSSFNSGIVVEVLDNGKISVMSDNGMNLTALPFSQTNKQIPIAGEKIIVATIRKLGKETDDKHFYLNPINIWDNPSFNAVDVSTQIEDKSSKNYFSPTKIQHISNLISLPGDTIYEGRFGQSIRFGNTNSNYPNSWSSMGETGDPITIINNGQPIENRSNIENIKYDLSSIYLTSYQSIANFSLANENFTSFRTKPCPPSDYVNPQIILNSSRVILNANNFLDDDDGDNLNIGDVLISGEKSVGLSSNNSINIEAGNETIISGKVFLGDKSAKEPALLGDATLKELRKLITEVKNISLALQTIPFAVGPVATLATPVFEKILADLDKITSTTVKLK